MKVVLFCGGFGMRLREFSENVPKPLVPIGDRPVIWHIMKYYAHFGHTEFILCLGYQGHAIKRYFLEYDETVSNDFVMSNGGSIDLLGTDIQDWRITFVDTGLASSVGERLRRVEPYLDGDEMFLANYSDLLTDFHLPDLVRRVESTNDVAGLLAVRPPYSFHVVDVEADGNVRAARELGSTDLRINGGYFVFRHEIFNYLGDGDDLVQQAFPRLTAERRLSGALYDGFWMSMDTFKERQYLEDMWVRGERPWQLWDATSRPALVEGARRF